MLRATAAAPFPPFNPHTSKTPMSAYTSDAASVPFFAIQPQRSRAPPLPSAHRAPVEQPVAPPTPSRPPTSTPSDTSSNMVPPPGGTYHHPNTSGGSSPFMNVGMAPAQGCFNRNNNNSSGFSGVGPRHAAPPLPMGPAYGDPHGFQAPYMPYAQPQLPLPSQLPPQPSIRPGDGRFQGPFYNNNNNNNGFVGPTGVPPFMPQPMPTGNNNNSSSYISTNYGHGSTSWMQDHTPAKAHNLNHFYDEPSMLSGATPTGLSTSRLREPRMGASRTGHSPSLLLSPQQAFSGVALEKDLLQAHKDELVQILLELASCNVAASSFIHTKARFFAFRRDVGQDDDDEHGSADRNASQTAQSTVAAHQGQHSKGDGNGDVAAAAQSLVSDERNNGARDEHTQSAMPKPGMTTPWSAQHGTSTDASRLRAHLHDSVEVASAVNSSIHQDSTLHTDTSRLLFSAADSPAATDKADARSPSPLPHGPSHRPSPVRGGHLQEVHQSATRRVPPEARTFVSEFHPCMRWYGTCRNPTSCVYVALPQNVCLNWVRGACAAAAECSGVHRLPDTCPPEVQRIYDLCHGVVDRRGVMMTAMAASPPPPPVTGNRMSRPVTRSPEASPTCGPHTPREQILSHPQDMIPSVLYAQNTAESIHGATTTLTEEFDEGCPEGAVMTASPSRLASCSEDTLEALLEQGLRPAIQTSSQHHGEDDDDQEGLHVFRCLNSSFARAAEQSSNSSNTSA